MITGIHHIKITIPAGPEAETVAKAFYCDLLGLPELPKPPELKGRGGFWLAVGPTALYVAVQDGIERNTKNHIGYSVQNLAQWREKLRAAGIEIRECLPVVGHDRFECQDPFGNRIEIQQV